MTTGIFEEDEIDILNDLERRIRGLEIATTAILHDEPQIVSGGAEGDTPIPSHIITGSIISDTLYAGTVQAFLIDATHIKTGSLTADVIDVGDLAADTAFVDDLTANFAFIQDLVANTAFITELTASSAFIDYLVGSTAFIDELTTNVAFIDDLTANTAFINELTTAMIDADSLIAMWADVSSLTVANTLTISGGGELRTTIGTQRTTFNSGGIKSYDTGTLAETFNLSAATGILTAKMVIQTGTQMPLGFIGGGNILPDSSFEGLNAATIWQGSGATIAVVTISNAFHGLKAMSVTALASGNFSLRHPANRVAVVPGKTYTATAYLMPSSLSGTVRIYIDTYNSTGTRVAATPGVSVALPGNVWTRISVTKTAESTGVAATTAVTAQVIVEGTGTAAGQVFYVDGVQLEVGEIATAYAPRPDEVLPGSITVNELSANSVSATQIQADAVTSAKILAGAVSANKISAIIAGGNLLSTVTTSFELNINGWSSASEYYLNSGTVISRDTGTYYHGGASMKVVTPGLAFAEGFSAQNLPGPFFANQPYTFSLWLKAAGAHNIQMWIANQGNTDTATTTTLVAAGWNRLKVTWTPTADWPTARVAVRTANATATTWYVDAVQLEQGDVMTAWKQYLSPAVMEGSTITGALIQTAVTGARVEMSGANNNFAIYDSSNVKIIDLNGVGGLSLESTINNYGYKPLPQRAVTWASAGIPGSGTSLIGSVYSNDPTKKTIMTYLNSTQGTAAGTTFASEGYIEVGQYAGITQITTPLRATVTTTTTKNIANTSATGSVKMEVYGTGSSQPSSATFEVASVTSPYAIPGIVASVYDGSGISGNSYTKKIIDTTGASDFAFTDGSNMGNAAVSLALSVDQSVSNPSGNILWTSEENDVYGMHSTSSNTDRITIPAGKAGFYIVTTSVSVDGTTGTRNVAIVKNGTLSIAAEARLPNTVDSTRLSAAGIVYLNVGDYLTVSLFHNSGSSRTVHAGYTRFAAARISI